MDNEEEGNPGGLSLSLSLSVPEKDDSVNLNLSVSLHFVPTYYKLCIARFDYIIAYMVSTHKQYGCIAPVSFLCTLALTYAVFCQLDVMLVRNINHSIICLAAIVGLEFDVTV